MFGFFTYPKRLNNLYADAIWVFLFFGNSNKIAQGDAFEIAVGAFVTASKSQRESMARYLFQTEEEIQRIYLKSSDSEAIEPIQSMQLYALMSEKVELLKKSFIDASKAGLIANRSQLSVNPRKAIEKGDDQYFHSNFQLNHRLSRRPDIDM